MKRQDFAILGLHIHNEDSMETSTLQMGRPGGASPICYERDVTQKMVEGFRSRTER